MSTEQTPSLPIIQLEIVKRIKECEPSLYSNIETIYQACNTILTRIPIMFPNYTIHDIGHSIRVVEYMNDLIADKVQDYSPLHLALIVIVGLIHDIGMCVFPDEKAELTKKFTESDNTFSEKTNDEQLSILQNYVRGNHGRRVKKALDYKINDCTTISSQLRFGTTKSYNLSSTVAAICQSHCEDVDWIKKNLLSEQVIGNDRINPQHIAALLRIGDALDIDDRRAPYLLYKLINPVGKSDEEWKKHIPITNYKKVESSNGIISIKFSGECDNPQIYRKITSYIDWLQRDIEYIIKEFNRNDEFALQVTLPIEKAIKTIGFHAKLLSFHLEYSQVLKLLMGEKIYGSKRDGLRELLQNAIDAAMLMKSITEHDKYTDYRPIVGIELDRESDKVVVFDNGTGMSEEILNKYFLNIGNSYYKSDAFLGHFSSYKPIGQFGIGFLSCFMLSAQVEILTKHYTSKSTIKVGLDKESPFITRFEGAEEELICDHGTQVCLKYSEIIPSIFKNEQEIKQYIEETFLNTGYTFRFYNSRKETEVLQFKYPPESIIDIPGGFINCSDINSEQQIIYSVFDDFDTPNAVIYLGESYLGNERNSEPNSIFESYFYLSTLREYIWELEDYLHRSENVRNIMKSLDEKEKTLALFHLFEDILNDTSLQGKWVGKYHSFIAKHIYELVEHYAVFGELLSYFNIAICQQIIHNNELLWLRIPIIANQEMFDSFLDTYNSTGASDAEKEFSPYIRWLRILYSVQPNESQIIHIINNFLSLLNDPHKTDVSKYSNYPIISEKEKKSIVQSESSQNYYIVDQNVPVKNAKVYFKGILVNDALITLPYSISGVEFRDIILNVDSRLVELDISRRKISNARIDELNHSVGLALFNSLLKNSSLEKNESSILIEFINKYYKQRSAGL